VRHVVGAAIDIEGLRVVRGRRPVLDGVSLRVPGESVTGLLGSERVRQVDPDARVSRRAQASTPPAKAGESSRAFSLRLATLSSNRERAPGASDGRLRCGAVEAASGE
jgi:hypothetical protein